MKRQEKQAFMTALHKDLQEIIKLLQEIKQTQFVALAAADDQLQMSTDVGTISEQFVKNGLEQFEIRLNPRSFRENTKAVPRSDQFQK